MSNTNEGIYIKYELLWERTHTRDKILENLNEWWWCKLLTYHLIIIHNGQFTVFCQCNTFSLFNLFIFCKSFDKLKNNTLVKLQNKFQVRLLIKYPVQRWLFAIKYIREYILSKCKKIFFLSLGDKLPDNGLIFGKAISNLFSCLLISFLRRKC